MQQLLNSFGCGSEQAGSKEAGVCWSIQWGWQILRRSEVNALLLYRQCPVHLHLKSFISLQQQVSACTLHLQE